MVASSSVAKGWKAGSYRSCRRQGRRGLQVAALTKGLSANCGLRFQKLADTLPE